MTKKRVYEFTDYKAFLSHCEQQKSQFSRGFRSRLAEELGCNSGFVSQVLNTGAHFSLEHALVIARFLELSKPEEQYFLLLVESARAGTVALKEHFKSLCQEMKERHFHVDQRVKKETTLSIESQNIYYSQWYYAAIHMLVTIPEFREISTIAQTLKLKTPVIEKAVGFLESVGLVAFKNEKIVPGPTYLHLEARSPNISKHHVNWRMMAIQAIQNEDKSNVHYSTVSTLSKADVEILRAKFFQEIEDYVQTVSKSQEEDMYCFNLDFFKLTD